MTSVSATASTSTPIGSATSGWAPSCASAGLRATPPRWPSSLCRSFRRATTKWPPTRPASASASTGAPHNWVIDVGRPPAGRSAAATPAGSSLAGIGYALPITDRFDWITEVKGLFYNGGDKNVFISRTPMTSPPAAGSGSARGDWALNFALRTDLDQLDIDRRALPAGRPGRLHLLPAPVPPCGAGSAASAAPAGSRAAAAAAADSGAAAPAAAASAATGSRAAAGGPCDGQLHAGQRQALEHRQGEARRGGSPDEAGSLACAPRSSAMTLPARPPTPTSGSASSAPRPSRTTW